MSPNPLWHILGCGILRIGPESRCWMSLGSDSYVPEFHKFVLRQLCAESGSYHWCRAGLLLGQFPGALSWSFAQCPVTKGDSGGHHLLPLEAPSQWWLRSPQCCPHLSNYAYYCSLMLLQTRRKAKHKILILNKKLWSTPNIPQNTKNGNKSPIFIARF